MRPRGERNSGSGSRCSQGGPTDRQRPGAAKGGHTDGHRDSRTQGRTDTGTDSARRRHRALTNPPPPAQPISEQPARRRPIKAPFSDCPAGQPMAGRIVPLRWAGREWRGRAGQSLGRALRQRPRALRGRPSQPPLAATVRRFLQLSDAAVAPPPFASGLRGTKEAGLARQGARDWLALPERVGGAGGSLLPIGWTPCPSRSAERPLGGAGGRPAAAAARGGRCRAATRRSWCAPPAGCAWCPSTAPPAAPSAWTSRPGCPTRSAQDVCSVIQNLTS
ncbi:zinc finger FYVE domain-containing protein 21 isoform X1 [Onychostruthus taczanowskii]|uniref:zinc finger FYVE domain-containing protein 21 isoform X1 n=1 Tax=Onychostruthus taczanowskii TaxID=356909 RepID=UPI001B80AEA9|nr:zinc finger FYVE domain-containing protein 21 isoform X1 [Onychostruthus taczanowskii]